VRLRQSARVADGLGGRVWGAAPLLVGLLGGDAALRTALSAASVLELGAGAGLAGLAARQLGAAHVTLTDAGAPQLALLRQNAVLNAAIMQTPTPSCQDEHAERDGVRVRHLDWDAPPGASCGDGTPPVPREERFSVVIAADVLYEPAHAAGVARAVAARLDRTAQARALLVCPVRCAATAAAFEARAAAEGLDCVRQRLPDGDGAERYEGGYARFDLRWQTERLLPDEEGST
jgi:predicted nicotinamide N-methyase